MRDRERLEVKNIMKGTSCEGGSQAVNRLKNSQLSMKSERKYTFCSHDLKKSHQMPPIPHNIGRAGHITK